MRMKVSAILDVKGRKLFTLGPDASVAEAVHLMNDENIGGVLVMEGDTLAGIFTERDVLRRVIDGRLDYKDTALRDVMTSDVACIPPNTTVEEAMGLVSAKRIRHLPVMEENKVIGVISIGDLTNSLVADRDNEIAQLTKYISGGYGA